MCHPTEYLRFVFGGVNIHAVSVVLQGILCVRKSAFVSLFFGVIHLYTHLIGPWSVTM